MQNDDLCLISVATFDRLAGRYAEKYFDLDLYEKYLEQFAMRITPQHARVIDIACGPGNIAARLLMLRPDLELTGVDLAEGMIVEARRRVTSAQFMVMDCRNLQELALKFDAAAFSFGLSYLSDADANRFFSSLNEILDDSALLYLSTITGEPDWSGIEASSSGDRIYQVYRTLADVVSMVEQAGYVIEFTDVIESPANAPKRTQDLVLLASRE